MSTERTQSEIVHFEPETMTVEETRRALPHHLERLTVVRIATYYLATGLLLYGATALLGRAPAAVAITASVHMVGAFLLAAPLAYVYVRTRTKEHYDRSLIPTVVILPVIVTAIVAVVRNNLALAFSLTGIVAAVRFRNNLKESNDAVYIFGTIGIGFAAGIQALSIAGVLSLFLTALELALWRFDAGAGFDRTFARLCGARSARCAPDPVGRSAGASGTVAGEMKLLGPGLRPQSVTAPGAAEGNLRVRVRQAPGARQEVQRLLDRHAKRWALARKGSAGDFRDLEFAVRLRRRSDPALLQDELLRAGTVRVVGLEWTPLEAEPMRRKEA